MERNAPIGPLDEPDGFTLENEYRCNTTTEGNDIIEFKQLNGRERIHCE